MIPIQSLVQILNATLPFVASFLFSYRFGTQFKEWFRTRESSRIKKAGWNMIIAFVLAFTSTAARLNDHPSFMLKVWFIIVDMFSVISINHALKVNR